MRVAVLGVGEAGRCYARDLLTEGVTVTGWDPAPADLPAGLSFAESNAEAARSADIILSLNSATASLDVAQEVAAVVKPHQLYADLNTSSPERKWEIAEVVAGAGAQFVDVAVMARVPPTGLRTPLLVSGRGAEAFKSFAEGFGTPTTLLDDQPGSAATRKLLRSVAYKGFAAVVVECLEAARALNLEDYAREQLATLIDASRIDALEEGSRLHAERRAVEMGAVCELLEGLEVAPRTARAAEAQLSELAGLEG